MPSEVEDLQPADRVRLVADPNNVQTLPNGEVRLNYAYQGEQATRQIGDFVGTPALANPYALFRWGAGNGQGALLRDGSGLEPFTDPQSLYPSVERLLQFSRGRKSTPYYLSDFLYCKWYGKIPNNHLVTLRRFPLPCTDSLVFSEETQFPPAAQAVTWLGEETENSLEEILGMSWALRWATMKADLEKVQAPDQPSFSQTPLVGGSRVAQNFTEFATGNNRLANARARNGSLAAPQDDDSLYINGQYGPLNVIDTVYRRERGMDFTNEIKLNFTYSLRSYDNINPKAALLDIIANLLALTFNAGQFWGGSRRYFGGRPDVPFLGDQDAYFRGDFKSYFSSVASVFSDGMGKLGDFMTALFNDPLSALKELASGVGGTFLNRHAAQNLPSMVGVKALLTGEPSGEWHLVVGNPLNPIAVMGNMICKGAQLKMSNRFGADDFPEEFTLTITLEHARLRDKSDIESMFNRGQGRLYYAPQKGNEAFAEPKADAVDPPITNTDVPEGQPPSTAQQDAYTGSFSQLGRVRGQGSTYSTQELEAAIGVATRS